MLRKPLSLGLLVVAGCGGPPLVEDWRAAEPRSAPVRCETHRGTVLRVDGELYEGVPTALASTDWAADQTWKSAVQGPGGWWISEVGGYSYVSGQRQGNLAWLKEGSTAPELVAKGSYAGVAVTRDGVFAVRGDCPKDVRNTAASNLMILEQFEVTADGISGPIERARWTGFCPRYATVDRDDRVLVVGLATIGLGPADTPELVTIDGDALRWVGSLPSDAWSGERILGPQMEVAPTGDLIFSAGISFPADDPEAMPSRVVRPGPGGALAMGVLVGECRPGPDLEPLPPAAPERALGLHMEADEPLVSATLLAWASVTDAIEHLRSRGEPVELALMDIPLNAREVELLLRLPAGSRLTRYEHSLDEASVSALSARRPDLL